MTEMNITGNLAKDPELRFTNTGTPVANLVVLENRRVKANGEWTDGEPNRFEVEVWGPSAQNVAESLQTGSPVMVMGTLITRKWTTKDDQTRHSQVVRADVVGHSLARHTVQATKTVPTSTESTDNGTDDWAQGE